MRITLSTPLFALLAAASLALGGCSFPNATAPGPSAIAVDSTANQVWVISSGKIFRCSPSGSALSCTEATTNLPR